MNDLTILHLSDLHIAWSAPEGYSKILKNLICDIKNQYEFLKWPIVVVVTGDIVDKGDFSENTKKAVLSFFTDLKNILKEKVLDIFLVAGNHDKKQSEIQKFFMQEYAKQRTPMESKFEELLNLSYQYYSDFSMLVEEIYKIYGKEEIPKSSYFVQCLRVTKNEDKKKHSSDGMSDDKGVSSFCFICLNSSLTCSGEDDYRHLRLGRKQIETISEQYHKITAIKSPELTFVLSHHPTNWLVGEEEDIIQNKILSPTEWNANILLCGHVHKRDAIGTRNNHHSMTTLKTGFGWPDAGEPHSELHTYSFYVFNLDLNSIDIYVRSTNDGGTFIPDFRFYGESYDAKETKVVYPIDINKTQAYHELSSSSQSGKAKYFSSGFVKKLKEYGRKLCDFQNSITGAFVQKRENFFFDFLANTEYIADGENAHKLADVYRLYKLWLLNKTSPAKERPPELKEFFAKNTDYIFRLFNIFMQTICTNMSIHLIPSFDLKANCPENVIRFHARFLSPDDNKYYQLCTSPYCERKPKPIDRNPPPQAHSVRGGLGGLLRKFGVYSSL